MHGLELGAAIRSFRLRRRQVHNEQPWTLDDLAVAIGGDKAHLSRIERGQTIPSQPTLLRIAHALELSWPETEYLLRLSGHAPIYEVPDAAAAHAAIRWVAGAIRGYLHPVVLYSVDLRVWYVNALWLRVVGLTPRQYRRCLQGRRLSETLFAPCVVQNWLATRLRDYDASRQRTVARFRAFALAGDVPEAEVAQALGNPQFRRMWEEAETALPQRSFPGEQSYLEVDYPGRGTLRFDSWWSPLQRDRRLLVVHHLPRDRHTRQALGAIRSDPRPCERAPCPWHPAPTEAAATAEAPEAAAHFGPAHG